MIATIINAAAVFLGSMIGILLRGKIHDRYETVVFTALGCFTVVMGITMTQLPCSSLYMVFSLVLGGLLGTWLGLEDVILLLGELMKKKLPGNDAEGSFATGFLDATVLFCVGAMTIVGSFRAGINKDYQLLLLKSLMDGSIAIFLAALMGWGVAFSAASVLVVQGGLTLIATLISPYIQQSMIDGVSAVGGVLVLMIGINLLKLKKIKTANFIPALPLIVIFQIADPWLSGFTGL